MEEALKVTRTCGLAVWSLILGILSLMCFGMFSGIPAVICGHLAQSRIRHSGGALGGGGLAIGGLVTAQAVYLWERKPGMLKLRETTKAALLAVRGIGAREAKARLAAMESKPKAKKAGKNRKKRA